MAIFSIEFLNTYLDKKQQMLVSKVKEYDYHQLKEFTESDYQRFCDNYSVQPISIDFNHFRLTGTRQGDGKVFDLQSYVFDKKVQNVRLHGMYVTIEVPVKSGDETIPYETDPAFSFSSFSDKNNANMNLSNDGSYIVFELFFPQNDIRGKSQDEVRELVKKECFEYIKGTKERTEKSNGLINVFNASLMKIAKDAAKKKIDEDSAFDFFTGALNIEVSPKNPSQRKGSKIDIVPKKATDTLLPERKKYDGYYIDKENYDAIIKTIQLHLVATEEYSKAILKIKEEELIRDTLLWALNANYFVAHGEAFRGKGKTDILIEFNDKSAFVAECKVWKGPQYVSEAIDQLFGYTTWRDSKAAIIVFNLEMQDFSKMCEELRNIAKCHKHFKRVIEDQGQQSFRCGFADPNNEDSNIEVAFLAANYASR